MPVRILLMDIDDTLFDFQTGYKRALRAALAQFGMGWQPAVSGLPAAGHRLQRRHRNVGWFVCFVEGRGLHRGGAS